MAAKVNKLALYGDKLYILDLLRLAKISDKRHEPLLAC